MTIKFLAKPQHSKEQQQRDLMAQIFFFIIVKTSKQNSKVNYYFNGFVRFVVFSISKKYTKKIYYKNQIFFVNSKTIQLHKTKIKILNF
jgi:hypothetical protein